MLPAQQAQHVAFRANHQVNNTVKWLSSSKHYLETSLFKPEENSTSAENICKKAEKIKAEKFPIVNVFSFIAFNKDLCFHHLF